MLNCPFCEKKKPTVDHLKGHITSAHKNEWKVPYKCGSCFIKTYPTISSWSRHLKTAHKDLIEQFEPNYNESCVAETDVQQNSDDLYVEEEDYDMTEQTKVSLEELLRNVSKSGLFMVASLRSNSSVTIDTVEKVVMACNDSIEAVISYLKCVVTECLGQNVSNDDMATVMTKFDEVMRPFEFLSTKKKQNAYFAKQEGFVCPQRYVFSQRWEQRRNRDTLTRFQLKADTWEYISTSEVLKTVLSNTEMLEILENRKPNTNGILDDWLDGNYCRNHPLINDSSKITIGLQFYYDDIEVCNPLGPNAGTHKLGVFYFSIKTLPAYFTSSMPNIHLVALAKTEDLKLHGYDHVLERIVEELSDLEKNGVQVQVPGRGIVTIFATIAHFAGDNLGKHTVFGFLESFGANRFCSHCYIHKSELQTKFLESDFPFRTKEQYDKELSEVQADQNSSSLYGIKRACALNKCKYWHVTQNNVGDLLHDFLKGVGEYEMKIVLYRLIEIEKHFTEQQLNERIAFFAYGPTDIKNQPSPVGDIKNSEKKDLGRQRGMPIWCLFRLLPLIIRDLIPEHSEYWEFYLELREIADILFAQTWSHAICALYRELYTDHLRKFKLLFPDFTLIPKHHFLLHYATFAEETGPPYKNNVAPEEMKGNFLKRYAGIMCNFVNAPYSLARKHQFFAYCNFLTGKCNRNQLEVEKTTVTNLENITCGDKMIELLNLPPNISHVRLLTKFKYRGQPYETKNVLAIEKNQFGEPVFGELLGAISKEFNPVSTYFVVQMFTEQFKERRLWCYCAKRSDTYRLVRLDSLLDYHPIDQYRGDIENTCFICPRYHL